MAKGVPEIEDGPQASLALVLADHPGLDLARPLDRMRQRGLVTCQQRVEIFFEPAEEAVVGDGAVLDDFSQAGDQLTLRQCVERVDVGHHEQRLVEHADHVLAQRVVDGRLAPHRRVDLRQQGGGHLHIRHAAHVARGRKARHVAHHAAAQGKQRGLAVAGGAQHLRKNGVERGPVLVNLAVGQRDDLHRTEGALQRRRQSRGKQRPHCLVGHDHCRTAAG